MYFFFWAEGKMANFQYINMAADKAAVRQKKKKK